MTLPLTPDELLTTTRSVRKRLDLQRPVPRDLIKECLEIATQAPSGGNVQHWHWMVVTDSDLRMQIGEYYRQSYLAYRNSPAVAKRFDGASDDRKAVQDRVRTSSDHLADSMGKVPVLVIGGLTVGEDFPHGNQAHLGIAAACGVELSARRARPRAGHRVDDVAPALREGDRGAARRPAGGPPGCPAADGVLQGRDVQAGAAGAHRERPARRPLVVVALGARIARMSSGRAGCCAHRSAELVVNAR